MPESRTVNTGQLLALLWRAPSPTKPRGPRPGLSLEQVVAAAIAIADSEGIHRLTIRQVAGRLSVAPMTVYTYVPGKAELLMLMLDDVHHRMHRSTPAGCDWRARVRAVADDNRALHAQHPWLVALPPNRPALGPGTLDKYEYELGAFTGTGLSDVEIDAALTFVLGFVESCAHAAARVRAAVADSAQTDAEWWHEHEAQLQSVLDPKRYPLGTRIGAAAAEAQGAAYDADHAYAFGCARVLDGLAALIAARAR